MKILITGTDGTLGCMIVTYMSYDKKAGELWFTDTTDAWKTSVCEGTAMNMIRDLFWNGYLDASYLVWKMEG